MAVTSSGEMLKTYAEKFCDGPEWRMHVADEQGATVCELRIQGRTGSL